MRLTGLVVLAAWVSCDPAWAASGADSRATWPSLARRPSETAAAPPAQRISKPGTGSTGSAGSFNPGYTGFDREVDARLMTASRDVEQLEQRWRVQLAATQRTTAAGRTHPGAESDAAAQLEAGRLDKLTGQIADERMQIESITGGLAVAAAAGNDVSVPLRTAGLLLQRCAKLSAGQTGNDGH